MAAQRGTARERGYGGKRWSSSRRTVLKRDPFCTCGPVCCPNGCIRISDVADHFPKSRKELLAEGVRDPDDPKFLRGLARSCHSRETNRLQGGWSH